MLEHIQVNCHIYRDCNPKIHRLTNTNISSLFRQQKEVGVLLVYKLDFRKSKKLVKDANIILDK